LNEDISEKGRQNIPPLVSDSVDSYAAFSVTKNIVSDSVFQIFEMDSPDEIISLAETSEVSESESLMQLLSEQSVKNLFN